MGQEYDKEMSPVHKSSILHGVMVGAGSLWPPRMSFH
jgi:hypothetical protein